MAAAKERSAPKVGVFLFVRTGLLRERDYTGRTRMTQRELRELIRLNLNSRDLSSYARTTILNIAKSRVCITLLSLAARANNGGTRITEAHDRARSKRKIENRILLLMNYAKIAICRAAIHARSLSTRSLDFCSTLPPASPGHFLPRYRLVGYLRAFH